MTCPYGIFGNHKALAGGPGAGYFQQRLRDVDAKYAPFRADDAGGRDR